MRRWSCILLACASMAVAGCDWDTQEDAMSGAPPPPAAAIAPIRAEMTLEEKLYRLETELDAALLGELDEAAVARLYRAEAITDRLLESELPYDWVHDYALETRIKQLQSIADRVVAESRRGVRPEALVSDVERLREHVVSLRRIIESGERGGPAPPPIDSLLDGVGGGISPGGDA